MKETVKTVAPDLVIPNATRITVIGESGVVYENYTEYENGCWVHIQDDGRTVKIFPRQVKSPGDM